MNTVNRRGKVLRRLLVGVVLFGVLIALLPWLASRMIVPGIIEDVITRQIDGTATIEKVSLSWFGEQRITGLTITDAAGVEQAKLDGGLATSLYTMLFGYNELTIALAGHATLVVDERGGYSLPGIRESQAAADEPELTPIPAEPMQLDGLPPTTLSLISLDLTLKNTDVDVEPMLLSTSGQLVYHPGGENRLDLVIGGPENGTVTVLSVADQLFDEQGLLTPENATASVKVLVFNMPLPNATHDVFVDHAEFNLSSDDLSKAVRVDAIIEADLGDAQTSELVADLAISEFLRNTGQVNTNPADIVGTVRGNHVPSALLQFAFAETPVVLSRDLGDVLDLDADLNSGQPGRVVASLNAEHASAHVDAVIDPQTRRFVTGSGEVTGRISPELVSAVSEFGIDRPGQFTLTITDLRDLRTADNEAESAAESPVFDVAQLSLQGALQLHNAVGLTGPGLDDVTDTESRHDLGTIEGLDLSLSLQPGEYGPTLTGFGTLAATITAVEFEHRTGIAVDRATPTELEVRAVQIPILRDDLDDRMLRESVGEAIELPLLGETWLVTLPSIGVQATARVPGPILLTSPQNPTVPIELQGLVASIESTTLGGGVHWTGGAQIGSGVLRFDEQLTRLFDERGQLDPRQVKAEGFTEITGIPGSLVAGLIPSQHAELGELLQGDVSVKLTTTAADDVQRATLAAEGERITLNAEVARADAELQVSRLEGDVTATPAMSAWLERTLDEPIQLRSNAQITFRARPFTLAMNDDGGWTPQDAMQARITMTDSMLGPVGPVREDWRLQNFDLELTVTPGDDVASTIAAAGLATVHRPLTDVNIADLAFDMTVQQTDDDQPPRINGTVNASNVLVRHVESIIGKPRGTFSYWLGTQGDVDLALDTTNASRTVNIDSRMPLLTGRYIASLRDDGMVNMQAADAQIIVSRHTFNQLVSPAKPTVPGESPAPPKLRLVEDAPFTLAVESCRFPLALVTGDGSFVPEDVNVVLSLSGGRLRMVNENRSPALLDDVAVSLSSRDLRTGIGFDVSAKAGPTVDEATGPVRITGMITNVLDESSDLAFAGAQLQLNASATDLPTAALDGLMDLHSLLLAAVGPSIQLEATADQLSRVQGSMDLAIESANGSLTAALISRDGHLRSTQQPVRGELELTEPFRRELLQKIHPVLADIRSSEHPLRVQVSNVALPLDGTVNTLNADIAIEVGAVQLDAGSSVLKLLQLFNETEHSTIDGRFDPIMATIRDGVLTYDRFTLQLDRYSLAYAGTIDLNARTIDLRTELPLAGLAMSIQELRGYADDIVVPIVTRGSFDSHETMMDPDFDLFGAAVEAGFRGTLNDLLKDEGIPLGDIFGEIFKQIGEQRDN